MREVTQIIDTEHPLSYWWNLLVDLPRYPEYVPFIKKVSIHGGVKAGSYWFDTTTIAYIPMKVRHNITELQEKRKIVFEVPQPTGGIVREIILLEETEKGTRIHAKVEIDYPKGKVNNLIERFLQKRFTRMLSGALENMSKDFMVTGVS